MAAMPIKIAGLLLTLCFVASLPNIAAYNITEKSSGSVVQDAIFEDFFTHFYQPELKSQKMPWPDSAWINHHTPFALGQAQALWKNRSPTMTNGTSQCLKDLFNIARMLKKGHGIPPWLISMVDAAGKPPPGILRGAMTWPGYFRECQEISGGPNDGLGHAFQGQYCTTVWNITVNSSTILPITSGICVTDSCHENLKDHIQDLLSFLELTPFRPFLKRISLNSVYCHPLPDTRKLDTPAIACLSVLATLLGLCLIGTVVDIIYRRISLIQEYKALIDDQSANENPEQSREQAIRSGGGIELHVEDQHVIIRNNLSRRPKTPLIVEIITSFSIWSNLSRLFEVKTSRSEISCVHGIRFLSMTWIILAHTYLFPILQIENLLDAFKDIDSFEFYTVINGSFSVDSFFVLSGFLLAYLYFSEYANEDRINEECSGFRFWFTFYTHRIWRLTPVYAMVLWINASVAHYASSGPFWDYGDQPNSEHALCAKSWWRNLLYINNFQNISEQCMAWSWYLANDMQFHIISPIFLVALQHVPKIGIALSLLAMVGSTTTTWLLSYHNKVAVGLEFKVGMSESSLFDYFDLIYMKPYCRVSAYIIGLLTGYAVHRYMLDQHYQTKKSYMYAGWLIALGLLLSPLYGSYHATFNDYSSAFYNALSRTSWSIGLCLMIYLSIVNNGLIDKFLSWSFWVPLSRLTFCAYLTHPILINLYYRSLQRGILFSHGEMLLYFSGAMVFVYLASIAFFLFIECPLVRLEKVLRSTR